ncbi:MAG: B12-binding domain-containing radical SAM protein [Deltaproteobacteria bacterium]|nr:B12-binding domain-containing radical SAM protein [Deltaproteobacteria bacterium]
MPTLLLINPIKRKSNWIRRFQIPPLSLLQLAALVPANWKVEIIDENIEELPPGFGADLVGITAMTYQASRAYEIAGMAREKGIPAVLGGLHPSTLPEEALEHAASVVIGEAEPVFRTLLSDFEAGGLKPLYRGGSEASMAEYPSPRRDLIAGKRYLTRNLLQTTRGCPWDCPFCSTPRFFGKKYRSRPINDVISDIASMEGDFFLFMDDNINGSASYCRELFRALIPLKKKWASQASLLIAEDDELLALARDSGCIGLFAGFDSLRPENRKGLSKYKSISSVEDCVKKIQDHGIGLEGSFVFGFDDDDPGVFERSVRWAQKLGLASATFALLTPYPGTPVFKELRSQDRILTYDWDLYNQTRVVIRPKRMTPEELWEGFYWSRKEFVAWSSIFRRLSKMPVRKMHYFAYNILRKGSIGNLPPTL